MIKFYVLDGFAPAQQPHDCRTPLQVGRWDKKNAVETSGATKGRIEMPRSIRGGQDQNSLVAPVDAVELAEELIDELAPRAGAKVGPACRQGIHLV
jgi:hypothetical protein